MIKKQRSTRETQIELELEIYGVGKYEISTGIGFFDHMLEAFCKHSLIDLKIHAKGDLHVDFHHTVEDVGILLGEAIRESVYPVKGIERFGDSIVVMDEAAIECGVDLSNRPFLVYESIKYGKIGEFDIELVNEFFRALAFNSHITLHLVKLRGENNHHIVEATFKAFALAFRRAICKNKHIMTPSTKGVL